MKNIVLFISLIAVSVAQVRSTQWPPPVPCMFDLECQQRSGRNCFCLHPHADLSQEGECICNMDPLACRNDRECIGKVDNWHGRRYCGCLDIKSSDHIGHCRCINPLKHN